MRAKITKRLVDDQSAGARPAVAFDSALPGFCLKVTPAGRKVYQVRYRMGGRSARLRTYTIGRHGAPWTAEQARREAEKLLLQVRQGIDPAAAKEKRQAEHRGALTLETLSAEFLAIYGKTKLKPRSYAEYARAFKLHINPRLGQLKVKDITHGDVERLHHGMRAIAVTANRSVQVLSKFFSWAVRGGYRPDKINPCRGLERFKERGRERYLSPAEIAALGTAIRTCEAEGRISQWQAALFRCLLLTGMRRDELRTLPWRCVDLERGVFVLEDSKVGARAVPISAPVRQILAGLPRVAGNDYVFCGRGAGAPLTNTAKPWARVLAAAEIAPTRLHDLRHTAASTGISAGASLALIGGVLGHRSQQTTARYAHLADDPVRATSEAIAERIAQALGGGQAEVVTLHPNQPRNVSGQR